MDASIKADLLYYMVDRLEVLLYVEDNNTEEPDTDNEGMFVLSVSYQDKRFTPWPPFGVEDALEDMRNIFEGKLTINEIFPPLKE